MIGRMLLAAGWLACFVHVSLSAEPEWNGLHVTFGINPFNPDDFASLPRTMTKAEESGWIQISSKCYGNKFHGVRYAKDNDYAVVLLFDINGYIAGIQCRIAKAGLPTHYPPSKQRGNFFQDDGDYFSLTAYFVNPVIICTTGRTNTDYVAQGTGTGLYIQNGEDPLTDFIHIPSAQADVANTAWTRGKCFPGMGVHYWYSISRDMDCADFLPVFLLYNGERLTGFGWALGVDQESPHFEHPPHVSLVAFMNPVPQCLSEYVKLSFMHIYMTDSPWLNFC